MKPNKFFVIAKVSLTNAVAYRAAVISRFVFYTLFIYVFMSLWGAIYKEGGVYGYSYVQIVWYLIMTEYVTFVSRTSILGTMTEDVRSGAIAYQIGRPIHYLFYHFASSVGQVIFNAVCFGALAAVLGLIFVGPLITFSLTVLPFLLISVALSIIINYFFLALIGLTAFRIEDNFALYLVYQKLSFMLGMFLPVEFLPD